MNSTADPVLTSNLLLIPHHLHILQEMLTFSDRMTCLVECGVVLSKQTPSLAPHAADRGNSGVARL